MFNIHKTEVVHIRLRNIFFLAGILFSSSGISKDFGVRGHLFPISEVHFMQSISNDLQDVDWNAVSNEIIKKTIDKYHNLKNVMNLPVSQDDKVVSIDLSYTVPEDIWAPQPDGREVLLAFKGQKIDPLDYVLPDRRFFFFDVEDPNQRKLAESMYKEFPYSFVPVTIQGDLIKTVKNWGEQLYYASEVTVKQFKVHSYPVLIGFVRGKGMVQYYFQPDHLTLQKIKEKWNELL